MKLARWIDHPLPWISFGSLATAGVFSGGELAVMATPLLAAILVEARRWDVSRYRRLLEVGALLALLVHVFLRTGLVIATVDMLFLLIGIRLSLPREAPQHRQVLLMSFLLLLVTCIATFELEFLLWSLAWLGAASAVLLHHAWVASATLKGSLPRPPPFRQTLRWCGASLLLAGLCFAIMPRQTLGLRFFPWGAGGLSGGSAAGLSNTVDLFDRGPIEGNREVVLRVIPVPNPSPERRSQYEEAFALLRGLTLEGLEGQRWETLPDTPRPAQFLAEEFEWDRVEAPPMQRLRAEFFVAPNPFGLVPLPQGMVGTLPPPGMPLRQGPGGSTRWMVPSRRPLPLRVMVIPNPNRALEHRPTAQRLQRLTQTGEGTEAALAWSRRIVPEAVPPAELARRLTADLRTFSYTLTNPSGSAPNPLQDFLERTRAGHCEYFASALALALRYRGVPSRVVNGYRLGPWIQEGGYWLVTQDLAHSWVEYYDLTKRGWITADPTPSGVAGSLAGESLWAAVGRWTDALRFRWDRNVVRFSDEDQMSALGWVQERVSRVPDWRPDRRSGLVLVALVAIGILVRWVHRRWRSRIPRRNPGPRGLPVLRPLVRKAESDIPPGTGETARAWLFRLAQKRPDLASAFTRLADEVDAVAYGNKGDAALRQEIRRVVRAFARKP